MNIRAAFLFMTLLVVLAGAGCLQESKVPEAPPTTPGANSPVATTHQVAMVLLLDNVTGETMQALSGIDLATSRAATALGKTGLSGPGAEAVLAAAAMSDPAVLTVITITPDGTVAAAEPWDAKVLVGQNIGDQDVVRKVLGTQKPLMSDLFPLAQGGEAVAIEYPVFSADGRCIGAVSTTFSPYELFAPIAEHATAGTPYSFMVAQPGGRILYDPDPQEVGKETFNETLYAEYPGVLTFAREYAANRSGYATYSFYATGFGAVVEKEAFWTTAGLHGAEWRIIVIGEV
ncbi:polar amino acid transport system substrate-binding protein [Methanolinea mesophila]|uniref:cache domain-containing protein n=1 Tax=Methanolinea mesophila TaxID=547055 RepID=UPI001AE6A383|nr:cache domain-containing protein [Methanolinea mesophila]MBP1929961.1 polar amino acid transport system substrate-binding protein [Methanolinea mesophila]